ncbi:MAG: chorismate synthase [Muribaculaceae bacterium]|nr:chorismate synthase [Muribaculaceae bacterium]
MNTFGNIYRLTNFGESHGPAIGGVIDGVPAGYDIDLAEIQRQLDRRRTGQSPTDSSRNETDKVKFLSGLYEGKTLGTSIGFVIENSDAKSRDYDACKNIYRPNHADYTYQAKYGIRDYRGGGRASARETAVRVVGGTVALQILKAQGIDIKAHISRIGTHTTPEEMLREIEQAKAEGDSVGGIISCNISGVPAGLGEPVFGKLQAMLASAMMSINAAKGFEYGSGFDSAYHRGSQLIDSPYFDKDSNRVRTRTNYSGGIQGGISNGEDIYFNVAFKPVATIMRPIETIDTESNSTILRMHGRHDVCVVPRAVVVVEAMAAMTILDALLLSRATQLQ